ADAGLLIALWLQYQRRARRVLAFVREQPALGRQAAAVTGEIAVAADHAMAGHDDRQWIRAIRGADRAHRIRPPDAARDVQVTGGLAIRNRQQRAPHFELER